jgi:hypothetical protein
MPHCAAFADALRAEFGAAEVTEQIRRGMKGEPVFWARENGHEVGTRDPREGVMPAIVRPVVIGRAHR